MGNSTSSVAQELTNTKYSNLTVNSKLNNFINSKQYNSQDLQRIFSNLSDLIPDDGYLGFYVNRLKDLGAERFIELANKARALNDSPQRLFCWFLKNNESVR